MTTPFHPIIGYTRLMFIRSKHYQFGPSGAGSIGEAHAYKTVQGVRQSVEAVVEQVKAKDNTSADANHDQGTVILSEENLSAELVYRPDGSIERFTAAGDHEKQQDYGRVHTFSTYRAEDQAGVRKLELSKSEHMSGHYSTIRLGHETWKLEVDRQSGALRATHEEEVDPGRPPQADHDEGAIGGSALFGGVCGAIPLLGAGAHALGGIAGLAGQGAAGTKVAGAALSLMGIAANIYGMIALGSGAGSPVPFLLSGVIGAVEGGLLEWAHKDGEYRSDLESYQARLESLRRDPDIREV